MTLHSGPLHNTQMCDVRIYTVYSVTSHSEISYITSYGLCQGAWPVFELG